MKKNIQDVFPLLVSCFPTEKEEIRPIFQICFSIEVFYTPNDSGAL